MVASFTQAKHAQGYVFPGYMICLIQRYLMNEKKPKFKLNLSYHLYMVKWSFFMLSNQKKIQTRKPKGFWHSCQKGSMPSELNLPK